MDDAARRSAVLGLTRKALGALPGGRIPVSDRTRSMAPLLHGGEVLRWRRAEAPARRGDLLVFFQQDVPVVHRVLRRVPGGYVTKGDNRPAPDVGEVPDADVLGVVEAVERGSALRRLEVPGARGYARLVAGWSGAGAAVYRLAYYGDAVLRRLPGIGDRRVFRLPAWWLQAAGQRILHAVLFRLCHPARAAD